MSQLSFFIPCLQTPSEFYGWLVEKLKLWDSLTLEFEGIPGHPASPQPLFCGSGSGEGGSVSFLPTCHDSTFFSDSLLSSASHPYLPIVRGASASLLPSTPHLPLALLLSCLPPHPSEQRLPLSFSAPLSQTVQDHTKTHKCHLQSDESTW